MKRIEIAKLYECAEKYTEGTVKVCGWIRTNRDSKVLGFMEINDGSCFKPGYPEFDGRLRHR